MSENILPSNRSVRLSCLCSFIFILGNGYITTAVLKEILRELDDTLNNDDLDAMIEGNDYEHFSSRNSPFGFRAKS